MYEVEVKVRADHERVRERLADLGADPVGGVRQVDTYYDAPHRDFAETDEVLRIRRETDLDGSAGTESHSRARVTYKGPLIEAASKTREEHETAVDDGEELDAVFRGLGFEPAATVEKERERFRLRGYTVTLDALADLGEFVEVEREAAETEVEPVREGAYDVLRDLGLDPGAQIRTSYLGLLLDAQR
ncbi:MAG: class IV adenylate cyclase [Haloferacaceae archaeon]